jgi:hypothetical protein
VFYIRTVLTEKIGFYAYFFHMFIVNEYFTNVTKLRICAHYLLELFYPKSFPIRTLKITPQTVLFNDEDFHSVEILETVLRQSEVLAHGKKVFCKITPVSIQDLLVRAEISKPNTTMGKSHSCGDKRCKRS